MASEPTAAGVSPTTTSPRRWPSTPIRCALAATGIIGGTHLLLRTFAPVEGPLAKIMPIAEPFVIAGLAAGFVFVVVRRMQGKAVPQGSEANATERVKLEERLEKLTALAPDVMFIFRAAPDGSFSFPFANRQIENFFPGTVEQIVTDATPALRMIHPDDMPRFTSALEASRKALTPFREDLRLRHPERGALSIEVHSMPERQADGSTLWSGFFRDVTARRLAEEKLRQTAGLLYAVADGSTDAIYAKDPAGRYLLFNEAAARMVGKPVADVLGKDDREIYDEEGAAAIMAGDREIIATGQAQTEEEKLTVEGKVRTYHSIKAPLRDSDEKIVGVVGISRDITQWRRAEDELALSEERLRLAAEAGELGTWDWDIVEDTVHWSPRVWGFYGVEPDSVEITFEFFKNAVHPDDRETVIAKVEAALRDDVPYKVDYRIQQPSGRMVWIAANGQVSRDARGTPIRMVGIKMDITERRQAEIALRESERRLREVLEATLDGFWEQDVPTGKVHYSEQWARLLGYAPEEVPGEISFFESAVHPEDVPRLEKALNAHIAGLTPVKQVEHRIRMKSGEYRWFLNRCKVVSRDASGAPLRIAGAITDVTARAKAETALAQSEERLRLATKAANLGTWDWDVVADTVHWSPEVWAFFGYEPNAVALTFEVFRDALHPDDREHVVERVAAALRGEVPYQMEFRIRQASGRIVWVSADGLVHRDANGVPIRMVGLHQDITVRKEAEAALLESERRLRQVHEAMIDGFWDWSVATGVVHYSDKWAQLMGYSPEEVPSEVDFFLRAVHPDDLRGLKIVLEDHLAGRTPVKQAEIRLRVKGGEYRWFMDSGKVVERDATGQPVRMVGTITDITARKEAEAALKSSEQRYRTVVATMAEGVILQGADGKIVAANPAAEEILGVPLEQLLGRSPHDPDWRVIAEDYTPLAGDKHPNSIALRTGVPQTTRTMGAYRPDGTLAWLSVNARPILGSPSSTPEGVVCSFIDVTAQKQAAAFNREHMRVLEKIAKGTPLAETLDALLKVVERQCEPLITSILLLEDGQRLRSIAGPRIPQEYAAAIDGIDIGPSVGSCGTAAFRREPVLVEDIATDSLWENFRELALRHKFRACWSTPIFDREQNVLGTFAIYTEQPGLPNPQHRELIEMATSTAEIAISRHRSETALHKAYDDLRQTQEMLLLQERLRAFGEMASGVAHDINNAICPISLYSSLLLRTEPNLSATARDYLGIIESSAAGVGETISRLRQLYRGEKGPRDVKPLALDTILKEAGSLTRARWADMAQQSGVVIDLKTEVEPDLPTTEGIASEVREALINLIFNAVDAMPGGGTITLRARRYVPEDSGVESVAIEVIDTGEGMDEVVRLRCLEPFFTTKGHNGTGLGLSIVANILQHNGGTMEIDSKLGRGTTVRMILPVTAAPLSPPITTPIAPVAPVAPPPRRGPARKILLVDDDPLILRALELALRSEGHEPQCAHGGQAGIDAFNAAIGSGSPFDAVVTDLGMPQVDGKQVAAAVKSASPSTGVILLTGWGHEMLNRADKPPGVDQLLGKPVTPKQLREALASCVN